MSNVIPGISALKKRQTAGLQQVASLLPADADGKRPDWRRGLDYVPEGCTTPTATEMCGPTDDKPLPVVQVARRFKPFGVLATDGCNDPWFSTAEFKQRASRTLSMGQSAILARELVNSSVSDNPDFASEAVDLTTLMPTPGPVSWMEGSTALIYNMVNAGYVGDINIHAPSWLQPSFDHEQIGWTDPATRQAYIGTHKVAFEAGYSGLVGPGGVAGDASAPTAGWVYASGPVEYDFAPEIDDDALMAGNPRENDRYVIAERPGIVRYDACQLFAILIRVCES